MHNPVSPILPDDCLLLLSREYPFAGRYRRAYLLRRYAGTWLNSAVGGRVWRFTRNVAGNIAGNKSGKKDAGRVAFFNPTQWWRSCEL